MNLQPFNGQWLRHNSRRNPGNPTRKTGIPPGFLQEYVGQGKELPFVLKDVENGRVVFKPPLSRRKHRKRVGWC